MRGSPLIRFLLLAAALVATAVGLQRVTSTRVQPGQVMLPGNPKPPTATTAVPFRLILSAPALHVEISTGKPFHLPTDQLPISGTLQIDPLNPHLSLIIRWENPPLPREHRFAKLILEPPGRPTFTHVFDSVGDVDDLLELPLTPAP